MQTFVPHVDFERSARALDVKRLGKQRVEVIQIVRALTVPGYAWKNHPAVLMWRGHEEALGRYGLVMCDVWVDLGFDDTCAATIVDDLATAGISPVRTYDELAAAGALPPWLFDDDVRRSHRSALVRKDADHYRPQFPDVPDDVEYVWTVRSEAVIARERTKAENAEKRRLRTVEREAQLLLTQQAADRRRRSAAARKGWATRREARQAPSKGQSLPLVGAGGCRVPRRAGRVDPGRPGSTPQGCQPVRLAHSPARTHASSNQGSLASA
ncbi:MSMEG_6728 family protein [Terracoccus luteus]|uniref:Uncharacterized protein n=1 Tax=Terracoccus luteus TaxID=53356 RepID=A0A839PU34_9MICO|nr:MSMEG_6728 family protein [Terracoccus luteus]MBB2987768.1 hypothetical protein [Terracoccus luteus]MCP2173419.1 hypothetical protein [Terracoccus luteus]